MVNVARWRSLEALRATQADPDARAFAERTAKIATASPGVYAVRFETSGAAS